MKVIKVDHVAVVVENMETALAFWQDALGLPLAGTEQVSSEGVDVAFLPVGETHVELLRPTDEESGVVRFLAKRGGGMHHLCLAVADIDAALARLDAKGVELINPTAERRDDGTRYAFIHPKSTGGVLLELYEQPADG